MKGALWLGISDTPIALHLHRKKEIINGAAKSRDYLLARQFAASFHNVRIPVCPMHNGALVVGINQPEKLNSRTYIFRRSHRVRDTPPPAQASVESLLPCPLRFTPHTEFPPRQRDRPMHDHFFAERRRYDVGKAGEGLKDSLGHFSSQRFKQQIFAH
jgi:hypothetical protein